MATVATVFFGTCMLFGVGCFVAVHLIGLDILDLLTPGKSKIMTSGIPGYFDNQVDQYFDNCDQRVREKIQKKLDLRIRLSRLGAAAFGLIVLMIVALVVFHAISHR
jgi:hypothetical protein